jgi:hypothetical protein
MWCFGRFSAAAVNPFYGKQFHPVPSHLVPRDLARTTARPWRETFGMILVQDALEIPLTLCFA